jgi:hypothetical protein
MSFGSLNIAILVPTNGIMDIFRWKQGYPPSLPEPLHFGLNGQIEVQMKEHFTYLRVYEDPVTKQAIYQPVTAQQHCFRYVAYIVYECVSILHFYKFNDYFLKEWAK